MNVDLRPNDNWPANRPARSVLQEADETLFWLELLQVECGMNSEALAWLSDKAQQSILIFVTMAKNVKNRRRAED